MILRSSPSSPFGRKVKLCAMMLGLMDQIEIVYGNTQDPKDSLNQQNPLGKIPILVLDDGTALYDSVVICEYLDSLAGSGKLIPKGDARWLALRLQAEGDGILDAGILQVYEKRFRTPETYHQPWVDRQRQKIERALADLEANPPKIDAEPHVGHVTLACALGYLDFRFEGAWRKDHPNLVAWFEDFAAKVPALAETAPHD